MTSAPALSSASARSSMSVPTPTAAPTRRRPNPSFDALGYFLIFSMSLIVIRPVSRPFLSTTSSFSMRFSCRSFLDWVRLMPSVTVIRLSLVMTSATRFSMSFSKRRSRLVTIPTNWSPLTTGTPEMRYCSMSLSTSATFWSGWMVTGSTIMPLSDFLTLSTSMAWALMSRLRWMKPRPPSRAMLMAVSASVTVSMAALTIGMFKLIRRVSWVLTVTSLGRTSE